VHAAEPLAARLWTGRQPVVLIGAAVVRYVTADDGEPLWRPLALPAMVSLPLAVQTSRPAADATQTTMTAIATSMALVRRGRRAGAIVTGLTTLTALMIP
jgi:hypothetical protein